MGIRRRHVVICNARVHLVAEMNRGVHLTIMGFSPESNLALFCASAAILCRLGCFVFVCMYGFGPCYI